MISKVLLKTNIVLSCISQEEYQFLLITVTSSSALFSEGIGSSLAISLIMQLLFQATYFSIKTTA